MEGTLIWKNLLSQGKNLSYKNYPEEQILFFESLVTKSYKNDGRHKDVFIRVKYSVQFLSSRNVVVVAVVLAKLVVVAYVVLLSSTCVHVPQKIFLASFLKRFPLTQYRRKFTEEFIISPNLVNFTATATIAESPWRNGEKKHITQY